MSSKSKSPDDEEILNVLREADSDTLTTPEIADSLPIGRRATQNRVQELKESNRLVLDREGNTNRWRLETTEPHEPIYDPEIAEAKRKRAKAYELGDRVFIVGIGFVSAAGIVMAYHVFFLLMEITVPILSWATLPLAASAFGLAGSVCFLATFLAKAYGFLISRHYE